MKKYLFLAIVVFFSGAAFAQTVTIVKDAGLNGQLKRMVYLKWNDWKPSPTGNWQGFMFWQITNRKYYRGSDKRPYKIGGNHDQDHASLMITTDMEEKIRDSVKKEAQDEALNLAARSGGALDVPYHTYFKSIFNELLDEVENYAKVLQRENMRGYNAFLADRYYQNYKEIYLDFIKERIATVNKGIAERGDRILSYIEIQRQLEQKNRFMLNLIALYRKLVPEKDPATNPPMPLGRHKTDAQIKDEILQKFQF